MTTACASCNSIIEYDESRYGSVVDCPTCIAPIFLPSPLIPEHSQPIRQRRGYLLTIAWIALLLVSCFCFRTFYGFTPTKAELDNREFEHQCEKRVNDALEAMNEAAIHHDQSAVLVYIEVSNLATHERTRFRALADSEQVIRHDHEQPFFSAGACSGLLAVILAITDLATRLRPRRHSPSSS